jgi:hypothetical protein
MAAGDNLLSTWATFLYELRGKVVQLFPTEAPFLAELSGVGDSESVGRFTQDMDGNRDVFSDKSVRHTLIMAQLGGAGNPQEAGTWNAPHALQTKQVNINLVRFLMPFQLSVDVERDSANKPNASAIEQLTDNARISLARVENLELLGDGSGLQIDITDGATSLTTTCNVGANFDVLLPGTVWDIRTRASGADVSGGNRRRIASVNETTRVITWDTAAQASDGGSGSIVHTSADGIYIPGTYGPTETSTMGIPAQGLEQAAAITGTFQTLDKAANPAWQGTDGRAGDTTSLALSDQILGAAMRRARRAGLGAYDFGIGDPACIDLYKDGKLAQVRYEPQFGKIKSGFPGIIYDGGDKPFPLIKEPAHKKGGLKLIDKKSFQLYGDAKSPGFLEDDGAMFRRFTRTFMKEADLVDRMQMGVIKCNTIVFLNNLAQA